MRGLVFIFITIFGLHIPTASFGSLSSSDTIAVPEGYVLVWNDEFNVDGRPDSTNWSYETGFVRNHELQYYRPENAAIEEGKLIIYGKREKVKNDAYDTLSKDWREVDEWAGYTSASLITHGKKAFTYGIFEIRAKIPTALGMWPVIWTMGENRDWPANGEVDIMEYYRWRGLPTILANVAWEGPKNKVQWADRKIPLSHFLSKDADWTDNFHIWKMEWTPELIRLYLDDELLNELALKETINPDGYNPFHHPHYILINLAMGVQGGDPSHSDFPQLFEIDYVRVFQKVGEIDNK
ncbi:glycoside hydrolase family 16 protein [Anditalea andensis]|uniref:Beta-glucanase n=1 Tax=Anditalea andensis TaxID=1048983 RepID=A0A074L7F2_9BACT|nr:glycoside hydrolase family 16 protein [Anditalea andensis]KEO75783.1 beta-glucanase [Anditalea andensis]